MTFKIATWNVNSLRVRLPHVLTWLQDMQPDALALQEIKLPDSEFPFEAIQEAGYTAVCSGQRTYNGVAIISRQAVSEVMTDFPGYEDQQRRVLGVTLNDIRILNIYIPNGESILSEKYQYKLRWLKNFDNFLKNELRKYPKLIVVGDFNIAPDEIDVHDPKLWQGQVLFSDLERQAFREMLQAGFSDCFRQMNRAEKKFSWWDYRLNAYRRNLGLRIDHILASTALSLKCHHCSIDTAPRAWERPSDHAPVVAEFK